MGHTSFLQDEQPHVSVLCEYDALPEIGHACGHNLIAECGVAAGIGIKAAMDNAGRNIGKVKNKAAHHHFLCHFILDVILLIFPNA